VEKERKRERDGVAIPKPAVLAAFAKRVRRSETRTGLAGRKDFTSEKDEIDRCEGRSV